MNADDPNAILGYIRQVATCVLAGQPIPDAPESVCAVSCCGAFVTFRNAGKLRGCMGRFGDTTTLDHWIADVTRSALNDPRFVRQPITSDELPALRIELSILGPRERVADPSKLIAGVHGVMISRDQHSGCFLPQVATDRNWSIETFLSECCRLKCNLPPDAWRDPMTVVEAFEARILEED